MKPLKNLLIAFSIILFAFNANAQHTAHFKVVNGNYPNGYYNYPASPGDTLYLQGTFTYMAWGGVGDTTKAAINIIADSANFKWNGNPTQGAGFNFQDCNNFHISGAGTGDEAGYHIHIKNAPGVAVSISGKSNWFEVDHIDIDTAFYFVWFKDEPQDHPCDSSYWYGHNVMTGFYLHDIREHYCHQDGNYLGSTDQKADRNLTCNGVTYHPLPAQVKNVRVARIWIRDVQRTGIQLSGGIGNYNYIDSNDIANTGFELNSQQGTGITVGGNTHSDSLTEVAYNKINGTYNYNFFSQGYGVISFHDNTCDSAGYIYGNKNGQQLASAEFSSFHTNTTWLIYNNSMGVNTANPYTNISMDATTSQMTSNSVVCNTGKAYSNSQPFTYSTDCSFTNAVSVFDTTYETISIIHDSLMPQHFKDSVFVIDSVTSLNGTKAKAATKYRNYVEYIITSGNKTHGHYELREWDSAVIVHNGSGYHDTTLLHITTIFDKAKTNFGLLDANGIDNTAQQKIARCKSIGVKTIRIIFNHGQANYQVATYKNAGLKVSLTFNWDPVSAVAAYPSDTAAVTHYLDSLFAANASALPDFLFIANEPANGSYHIVDGPAFVKFLTACVRIAKKYDIPVSFGGSTQDIMYPLNEYYRANGLTDSTNFLQSVFGTFNTSGPTYIAKANFYAALIPAAASLGLFAWNFHWYEWADGDATADANATATSKVFPVAADFIKKNTGLDAVSDEWGTRNTSTILFNATAAEIQQRCKRLMTYYLSDNSSLAKNDETPYTNYIIANP